LDIGPGVIALRGRNESGKSSCIEAITYALFGAVGLQEALEHVVTYGQKTTTLKVILDFEIDGVVYRVSRGSSGAEIRSGSAILATGQTEVRKFIEKLLGASADVCINLMFANQTRIRGALDKGPNAAVELIEMLSNLAIIDKLISLVQDQLPCGTTVAIASRVATLEEQLDQPVAEVPPELVLAYENSKVHYTQSATACVDAKSAYDAIQVSARAAEATVNRHAAAQVALKEANSTKTLAEQTLAGIVVGAEPDQNRIAQLRQAVADNTRTARAIAAYNALKALPEPENEWEGDEASLAHDKAESRGVEQTNGALRHGAQMKIAQLQAQMITQTECGLCGKDLSNVPEVVAKNADLQARIAAEQALVAEVEPLETEAREMAMLLENIEAASPKRQTVYQQASEFITLNRGFVPARWTWIGPDTSKPPGNEAQELAQLEAGARAYQAALGRQTQAQASLDATKVRVTQAQAALEAAEAALPTAQEVLKQAADATATLNTASQTLQNANQAVESARQALESAQAVHQARQEARTALEEQLATAKAEIAETEDNNALIKALREARPAIADEIWAVVMASVGAYFSAIRGVPSVVERSDNGFKVDGHQVTGLSGSTKDALGLAIRKALTKTFLPQTSFMVLDEPAAAMDAEREAAMLGLIATSGFEQMVVVSHSELLDGFANQIIQL